MSLSLSVELRNAQLATIKAALDANTSAGKLLFYSLPFPATTGAAITSQVLLATCVLSKPSGNIANGVMMLDVITDELATPNSGAIAFGRLVDGAGGFVGDGNAGLANSTAFFKFNSVDVLAGGTVKILSATLTAGNP